MQHLGKLVGLVLGIMMTGNMMGAIAGFLLGNLFDRYLNPNRHIQQQARQQLFFQTTFQVMGNLSKAKGRVTESDIQAASKAMAYMRLNASAQQAAQQAFRQGKASDYPLRTKLRELRRLLIGRTDLLRIFMEIQIDLVFADGKLHPNERQVLYVIAEELGIPRNQFEMYLQMREGGAAFAHGSYGDHRSYGDGSYDHNSRQGQQGWQPPQSGPTLADALKVLGVNRQDEPAAIKRAYRRLMNEHHPDKLVAKGLPPEMIEMANEKTQEIQAAYDLIKRELGFK